MILRTLSNKLKFGVVWSACNQSTDNTTYIITHNTKHQNFQKFLFFIAEISEHTAHVAYRTSTSLDFHREMSFFFFFTMPLCVCVREWATDGIIFLTKKCLRYHRSSSVVAWFWTKNRDKTTIKYTWINQPNRFISNLNTFLLFFTIFYWKFDSMFGFNTRNWPVTSNICN